MKLTYKHTKIINFIAVCTAEATNDNTEIQGRIYNNGVEVYFTCDRIKKVCHILYIESKYKNNGNASMVIKEITNEFLGYTIIVDAVYFLKHWYERLGFVYKYDIDEMMCYRMLKEA